MGYFTTEQLEEIKQYILDTGTKDTDLPLVSNVSSKDEIVIVQNGYNKRIELKKLFSSFGGITQDIENLDKFNKDISAENIEIKDSLNYFKDNTILKTNLGQELVNNLTITNGNWVANNTIIGQATGNDGKPGANGKNGTNGIDGKDGQDGNTWKPFVDDLGNLSWQLDTDFIAPEETNIKGEKGDSGGIFKPILINNNIQYEYTESVEDFDFNFDLNSLTQSNELVLDNFIYVRDFPSKCFISGVNIITYVVGGVPTINIVYDGTSKESFVQVKETTNLKFVDESGSSYMLVYKDEDGNYTETSDNINLNPSYIYKIIIQNGISSGIACYNGWGMSVEVVEQSCRQ